MPAFPICLICFPQSAFAPWCETGYPWGWTWDVWARLRTRAAMLNVRRERRRAVGIILIWVELMFNLERKVLLWLELRVICFLRGLDWLLIEVRCWWMKERQETRRRTYIKTYLLRIPKLRAMAMNYPRSPPYIGTFLQDMNWYCSKSPDAWPQVTWIRMMLKMLRQ